MMSLLGLRTAIYRVSDLAAARDWYTEVLGFGPYFDEPFYVGFNVAGYELGLQPDPVNAAEKSTSVCTYWGVDDVSANFERLLNLGATAFEQPDDVGSGIVVAMVSDPWGNLFGLIFNPHFSLGTGKQ